MKIGAILFQIVLLCLFRQFTADNRAKKCANRPFWMADRLSDNLRRTEKEGTRFPQPRFSPVECSRFISFDEPIGKHLRTHHGKSAGDYTTTDSNRASQSR